MIHKGEITFVRSGRKVGLTKGELKAGMRHESSLSCCVMRADGFCGGRRAGLAPDGGLG